jgi:hypothetical protein
MDFISVVIQFFKGNGGNFLKSLMNSIALRGDLPYPGILIIDSHPLPTYPLNRLLQKFCPNFKSIPGVI